MPQRYPTDLTDTEWTILLPLIPAVGKVERAKLLQYIGLPRVREADCTA